MYHNYFQGSHPLISQEKCEQPVATLLDQDLWSLFRQQDTEMIITKSGRKLFPTIRVQFYNLKHNGQYRVILQFRPIGKGRLKYNAKCGWKEAGSADPQPEKCFYVLSEKPQTGLDLMSKPVSFEKLRVTNSTTPLSNNAAKITFNSLVCLNSMHRYMPTIILENMSAYGNTLMHIPLELAQFVAVTAYQNTKITQIKIDQNPFAKGFRADGQAKCKKRKPEEEEESIPEKTARRYSVSSNEENSSRSSSSPSSDNFPQYFPAYLYYSQFQPYRSLLSPHLQPLPQFSSTQISPRIVNNVILQSESPESSLDNNESDEEVIDVVDYSPATTESSPKKSRGSSRLLSPNPKRCLAIMSDSLKKDSDVNQSELSFSIDKILSWK